MVTISSMVQSISNKHALNTLISKFRGSNIFDFYCACLIPCSQIVGKIRTLTTPMIISGSHMIVNCNCCPSTKQCCSFECLCPNSKWISIGTLATFIKAHPLLAIVGGVSLAVNSNLMPNFQLLLHLSSGVYSHQHYPI